jgi:DNA-binding transcriptional LysR family regulator
MDLPVPLNLMVVLTILLRMQSVSRAAAALSMSQPGVSRALAELRAILKDPLLVRSGNTMVRTRRGEDMLRRLEEWLALTACVTRMDEFHPATVERRFRIASTDFGVMSVIVPALPTINREAPGVAIDIVPLSRSVHASLVSGALDLAITGLDNDPLRLHSHLLFIDDFACLMGKRHPLMDAADEALPLQQFLSWPHVSLTISDAELDRVTESLGALTGRRIPASLPYFAMAPDLIGSGDALMLLPQRAAQRYSRLHDLAYRQAPPELRKLEYWLAWHERSHRDPACEWLRGKLIAAPHPYTE